VPSFCRVVCVLIKKRGSYAEKRHLHKMPVCVCVCVCVPKAGKACHWHTTVTHTHSDTGLSHTHKPSQNLQILMHHKISTTSHVSQAEKSSPAGSQLEAGNKENLPLSCHVPFPFPTAISMASMGWICSRHSLKVPAVLALGQPEFSALMKFPLKGWPPNRTETPLFPGYVWCAALDCR